MEEKCTLEVMTDRDEHTKEIVRDILDGMGFKKDDAYAIRNDLVYLRKKRKGSEDILRLIRRSVIGASVPVVLYVLWEVFKGSINK